MVDTTAVEQLMVEKFRQKFSTIAEAFQSLDVRGDSRITAEELQASLASKFDIKVSDELAAAVVARYNAAAPSEPVALDFASFAELYDGTFTQYCASSIGAKADPSDPSVGRAHNFVTGHVWRPTVNPTAAQAALATVRRISAKLRQHASSSARSRHFTELFVKLDVDRTGTLTADEIRLGLFQLGLDLKPHEVTQLVDAVDVDHTGKVTIANFMMLVQRGTGVDAAPAPGKDGLEATAAMPETVFVAEPQMLPAEVFKTQIAESSSAHVAVGKIVSVLDDRKMKLRAAFKKLDVDNDGSISVDDLPKGLASIGVYISPTRASKMVAAFDRTGDGRLHYHEFVRLLSVTRAEEHEEKTVAAVQPAGGAKEAPGTATAAPAPAVPSVPEPEVGEAGLVAAGTEEGGMSEPADESLSDVLAAISYSVYSAYRGARKAFGVFETTGDKQLSKTELSAGLQKAGIECSSGELGAIYERFDLDGSGALSFSQFVKLLAAAECPEH